MSCLNRGRKIILAGVALLGGHVVIRGNFGHTKSHLPRVYCTYRTACSGSTAGTAGCFLGLPTGLFCVGCFTAGLGAREAEGLGPGLNYSVIILYS